MLTQIIQNLDIQYTVGVAQGVPVTFISAGSDNTDGFDGFLDMINYILGLDSIPNVLTTSYAFNEPGLDSNSANSLCNAYMQLGARGTSIVCLPYCSLYAHFSRNLPSSLLQVTVGCLAHSPPVARLLCKSPFLHLRLYINFMPPFSPTFPSTCP